MKIGPAGFFDLAYCSNIHPGETWPEIFTNLKTYIPPLKEYLAPKKPFGIGLRLSNQAAAQLLEEDHLKQFKEWLTTNKLYVFTINGFPYGGFHHQRVKDKVYAPDWLTKERRDYSLNLIKILAEITPVGGESGFSTIPITYKPWLVKSGLDDETVYQKAIEHLCEIVIEMEKIHKKSSKLIHIDIEPEPDCLIETVSEAIHFFNHALIPIGTTILGKEFHIPSYHAEKILRDHVRFCYDICHSSVEYENPVQVFKRLADANIKIGKIQISAALKTKINKTIDMQELAKHLKTFADPVYLHQVIAHNADGSLHHFSDLKFALSQLEVSGLDELRTHFHVPLFVEKYKLLQSTQNDVVTALKLLQQNKAAHHLEIETYTWEVLPANLKLDILSSLKREYEWVIQQFNKEEGV